MKVKILKTFAGCGMVLSSVFLLANGVLAAQPTAAPVSSSNNSLIPEQILNIFNLLGEEGSGTAGFITGRVRTGLFIALALLILVAVIYALLAAFKYIQSQGDPGKIEDAQKAIKAIFMGIAAMMIGIVGIVLVFVFFSASRPAAELFQTCLSAPNSVGCESCKNEGRTDTNDCGTCEGLYETFARGGDPVTDPICVDPLSQN